MVDLVDMHVNASGGGPGSWEEGRVQSVSLLVNSALSQHHHSRSLFGPFWAKMAQKLCFFVITFELVIGMSCRLLRCTRGAEL